MPNEPRRRGLGRGLGALIMDTAVTPMSTEAKAQANAGGVLMLPISLISPNPQQPRSHFDETTLAELADSIRAHGIIQPLVVTADTGQPDHYWIVAGERRWRAARLANLAEVPVIVREASPQQLMEWALVENLQRDDLNAIEEATAFRSLMAEFGLTQAEVAERVGKSRSAVANSVRLLNLPEKAQEAVINGEISPGHARALLALPEPSTMIEILEQIRRRDLNVRQTENMVRKWLARAEGPAPMLRPPDPALEAQISLMENRFRSVLGTRVSLNRNHDGSGKLIVHFYSDDDLEAIYQAIAREEYG